MIVDRLFRHHIEARVEEERARILRDIRPRLAIVRGMRIPRRGPQPLDQPERFWHEIMTWD